MAVFQKLIFEKFLLQLQQLCFLQMNFLSYRRVYLNPNPRVIKNSSIRTALDSSWWLFWATYSIPRPVLSLVDVCGGAVIWLAYCRLLSKTHKFRKENVI